MKVTSRSVMWQLTERSRAAALRTSPSAAQGCPRACRVRHGTPRSWPSRSTVPQGFEVASGHERLCARVACGRSGRAAGRRDRSTEYRLRRRTRARCSTARVPDEPASDRPRRARPAGRASHPDRATPRWTPGWSGWRTPTTSPPTDTSRCTRMYTGGCATRSPRSTPAPASGARAHRRTTTGAEPNVAGVARRRLDAELVRRKLARSREHAGQLIAAGRVTVGGDRRDQVRHPGGDRGGDRGRGRRQRPRLRLARRPQAGRRAGGIRAARARRRGAAGAGRRRVHRRLHRCAAARGRRARRRRGRRIRAARLVAAERRAGHRQGPYERTRVDARSDRRGAGRPGRGGSVLHPARAGAARPGAVRRAGRRPGADGQAAVRGGQGAAGQRRSRAQPAAARRGRARRWPARAWELGLGVLGVTASPLPGPSGNVEYFLWLRAGAPELDPADVDRAVAEGPR